MVRHYSERQACPNQSQRMRGGIFYAFRREATIVIDLSQTRFTCEI
jgi:hypothetical protein